ncbi:MAG TPA: C40 family peptidase [Vicinamibacterales bacterium]|nr:C40 family peptidase [Vicinamibacterales bacterium]
MFRSGAVATLALVLTNACASSTAVPRPFPVPGPHGPAVPSGPPPPVGTTGQGSLPPGALSSVVGTALSLRGAPYRSGGADPRGFDCSGFIAYVFARHGIPAPRTVVEQFSWGRRVADRAIAPGDLVFFDTTGGVSHVGLAIGGDEFVHAPSARGEVRVERLSSGYWRPRFVGARRLW